MSSASTDSFCAAVVAGGLSTRMGEDKASLRWQGATFLDHRLAVLRALSPAPAALYLSVREAKAAPAPDVEVVPDLPPYAERGPLGGLFALLSRAAAAGHARLLVLAVDMPRMTPEWLSAFVAHPGGAVPELSGGCLEPLAALWPTALLPEVRAALDGPDASLHRLARAAIEQGRLAAVPVPGADEGLFLNVNRKSDLEALNTLTSSER